jgi:hypothetical protein
MANLTFDDFDGRIGTIYVVTAEDASFPLRLEEAQPLPDSGREGGAFRLVFRGPSDPILPQAIYPFRQDADTREIFVVPIAQGPDGTAYEAIFC